MRERLEGQWSTAHGIITIPQRLVATQQTQVLQKVERTNEAEGLWAMNEETTHVERCFCQVT